MKAPTEDQQNEALDLAIRNVATCHGLDGHDYMKRHELYAEIQKIKSPLLPSLDSYIKAYNRWHKVSNASDGLYSLAEVQEATSKKLETRRELEEQVRNR